MSLTELAIRRPSFIVVIFTVLTVLGIGAYFQLSYELLPKMKFPALSVVTIYPGASPQEIEASVSKKIEEAVSSLDRVKRLRTTSSESTSLIVIELEASADVDFALQETQRKINQILNDLPEDCKTPNVVKFALDEVPIIRLGVTGNMEARAFYQFVKDNIQPRLATLHGVGQVGLIGGEQREIKINVDAAKLQTYNIPILQVVQAIRTANLDVPTGTIKDQQNQFIVRLAGKVKNVEDLKQLIIAVSPRTGGEIRLGDVADVYDGRKDYANINRINGVPSIGITIQKQSEANAVELSQEVRKKMTELEKAYSNINLKFDLAQDTTEFTIEAANAVKTDLALAVILVAVVMLLFLHSFTNSLIVLVSIPASIVSTFIAMYALGFSLNLMTLLGLSLVVGILVDDSIVVLENIYRHLEMGKHPRKAALDGRNEIGFTALSITLVDVVVFLPLSLTGGIIGNIMREFALVVVFSTLMSLFVSFTVTPMLASRFSKYQPLTKKTLMGRFGLAFEAVFESLKQTYSNVLSWCLTLWGKLTVLVVTIALFVGSLALVGAGFIGGEFITITDRGEFSVLLELAPGTTIEQSNRIAKSLETKLQAMPEVKKVITGVGVSSEGLLEQSSANIVDFQVALKPKKERTLTTNQVGNNIKRLLYEIPGSKGYVRPIGIFGSADEAPIQIVVASTNRDDVRKTAKVLEQIIAKTDGTADIKLSAKNAKPEVRLNVDRSKLADFGLTIADLGTALRTGLSGYDNSKFTDKDDIEYSMRIQLDDADREKFSDVGAMTFLTPRGKIVELKQVAEVEQTFGPTNLERVNRVPAVTVSSQVIGRAVGTVGAEIQKEIEAKVKDGSIPKSVNFQYLGQLENQAESFSSMGIAMMIAILFVYLIMVALYDSYIYPFVVLFSIPVAIVGALLALALTMKSLNIFSILGIIMMIGLVAKNAILLVDFTNQLKAEGYRLRDALLEAGRERLRPILMTTLAMVIGMLPIALASSAGSEWKTGLAWALIGGLTSSMLLTLIVVPCAYSTFDIVINFFYKAFGISNKPFDYSILEQNGHTNGNGYHIEHSEKETVNVSK
jgi:HAE1 family hydrophobic/amphiphilic exporter-1